VNGNVATSTISLNNPTTITAGLHQIQITSTGSFSTFDYIQVMAAPIVATQIVITNPPQRLIYTKNQASSYSFNAIDNLGGSVPNLV
jgi:type IV secretory pathway protease TraF